MSKRSKLGRSATQNCEDETFAPCGLKFILHGIKYQTILFSQCFWRVVQNGLPDFLMATEFPDAGKFDDIVMRYKQGDEMVARFLQVKHKQSGRTRSDYEKINIKHLLSTNEKNNYCILKYFRSYQRIQKQYSCNNSAASAFFVNCNIQDLILLTNEAIDEEVVAECLEVDRENRLEDDILLRIKDRNAVKYKIKNTENRLTRELDVLLLINSDFFKLVNVLADCLLSNKRMSLRTEVCREYLHPLVKDVLTSKQQGENYFAMLSEHFKTNTGNQPEKLKKLRAALSREIAFRERTDFKIQILETLPVLTLNNQIRKRKLAPPDCGQRVKLDELADRFENALRPLANVTASALTLDFCERNEIARQIVDSKKKTFKTKFIAGDKTLSPQVKLFRMILLEKVISDSEAEEKFRKVASTRFPISKGLATQFTFNSEPEISNPIAFAKQIVDLIKNCKDNKRNIKITEESGTDEFKRNLCKLAGHTIVKVDSRCEFGSNFISGRSISESVANFRNSLKESLGEEIFNSIDIYKFKIHIDSFYEFKEANFFKTLPSQTTYESIIDFYGKFRLVVNYPNWVKTLDLLRDELRETNQNLDQEAYLQLLIGGVEQYMTNYLGTFYTPKKATSFFQLLDEHLTSYEIEGVNQLKNVELALKYPFDCTHLKASLIAFLQSPGTGVQIFGVNNIKLNLSRIANTFQSLLKEYQTLPNPKRLQSYIFTFGFIYLAFEEALNELYRSKLSQKTKEPTKWSLRVVDCSNSTDLHLKANCKSVLEAMLENSVASNESRKIIFVVKASVLDEIELAFQEYAQNETAERIKIEKNLLVTKFSELECATQKILLKNSKVALQGRNVTLGDLITLDGMDLVDEDTLLELVTICHGEENDIRIEGGRQSCLFTYSSHPYIRRHIRPNFIDWSYIANPENIKNNIYYLSNGDVAVFAEKRNFLPDLKKHRLAHSNGNIHWLQKLEGTLIWRDSIGSTDNLSRISGPRKVKWSEEEFLEMNDNKIVILYGIPGAGKSRLLSRISKQLSKKAEAIYIVDINLNIYTDFLYKKKQERQRLGKVNCADCGMFLLEMLQSREDTRLSTQFEINLFRGAFDRQGPVKLQLVVFLDGFDEVCPAYKEIVLHFLQYLKDSPCLRQLFITTRPIFCGDLESTLNTFGHEIESLSKLEQSELFSNFVAEKGLQIEETESRNFLNEVREKLSPNDEQFTAIPLHLKILADIYADKSQERKNQLHFKDCNESELFEMYVKQKYEIFLKNQMHYNQTNAAAREEADVAYKAFLLAHEKLALWALYNPQDLKQITKPFESYRAEVDGLLRKIEAGQFKYGIIFTVNDGRPQFFHRTFAEYFSARYIHRCMEGSAEGESAAILNIILNAECGSFLTFLDSMIPEHRNWIRQNQGDIQMRSGKISSALLNLSRCKLWKVFDWVTDIVKEDSRLKCEVFLDIIEKFVDDVHYFMLLGFVLKWGVDLTWTTSSGKSILHLVASEACPWKVSRKQGKHSKCFYRLDQKYEIPLWLLNSDKFDMSLFQPDVTILEIFKILVKNGAKYDADLDNLTAFHYAAAAGNKDICEKFNFKKVFSEVEAKRRDYIKRYSEMTLFGKALRAEREEEMWSKQKNEKQYLKQQLRGKRELKNLRT